MIHNGKRRGRRAATGFVVSAGLLIAACGSDAKSTTTVTTSAAPASTAIGTTAASATTVPGTTAAGGTAAVTAGAATTTAGTVPAHDQNAILRVIGYSPPQNLDPLIGSSVCGLTHLRMIYDSLIRLDANGMPQPGLAESWKVVDDKTFSLTLRKGVIFQDGTPFNAAAVKAELERGKTSTTSVIKTTLAVIDSIEAPDDSTVILHLNQPRAGTLPTILAERAGMIPSPTAVAKDANYGAGTAVGAGPFQVKSLQPNSLLEVRTWGGDTYWANGQRLIAGADFYPVDDTLGVQRIESGEIDYMATKDDNLSLVANDKSVQHQLAPTNTFAQIFLNYGVKPFDDIRVRQAIEYALDREQLAKTLSGSGQVAWGPLNPTSWAHNPAVDNMYPFNPAKAKQLLTDAGYPNGLTFTAAMINVPYYTRMAAAVQDMLKESGITVNLESVPGAEINNALYIRKQYSAAITAFAGSTDPSIGLEAKYTTYGASNPSGKTVDGLEQLLADGARLVDQKDRAVKYQAAEKLIMDNALEVPIYFLGGLSVYSPKVHGIDKGYETCSIGNFIDPAVYLTAS